MQYGVSVVQIEYYVPTNDFFKMSSEKSLTKKLTLNLKNKKIRNFVLKEIIPRCDILLESYRPGVMERFGLDPIPVHEINP